MANFRILDLNFKNKENFFHTWEHIDARNQNVSFRLLYPWSIEVVILDFYRLSNFEFSRLLMIWARTHMKWWNSKFKAFSCPLLVLSSYLLKQLLILIVILTQVWGFCSVFYRSWKFDKVKTCFNAFFPFLYNTFMTHTQMIESPPPQY